MTGIANLAQGALVEVVHPDLDEQATGTYAGWNGQVALIRLDGTNTYINVPPNMIRRITT